MAISYKKLFKLLIDRDLKKKDLKDMTGISYATLHKLERGENMMTDVLNNICAKLNLFRMNRVPKMGLVMR